MLPGTWVDGIFIIGVAMLAFGVWVWLFLDGVALFRFWAWAGDRFENAMRQLGLHVVHHSEPLERVRLFAAFGEFPYRILSTCLPAPDAPLPGSQFMRMIAADEARRVVFGLIPLPRRWKRSSVCAVFASVKCDAHVSGQSSIVSIQGERRKSQPESNSEEIARIENMLPSIVADIQIMQRLTRVFWRTSAIDLGYSNGFAVVTLRTWPTTRAAPQVYAAMYRIAVKLNNHLADSAAAMQD